MEGVIGFQRNGLLKIGSRFFVLVQHEKLITAPREKGRGAQFRFQTDRLFQFGDRLAVVPLDARRTRSVE